jgi:hypothetical protein
LLTSRDQINCALQRERKQVLTVWPERVLYRLQIFRRFAKLRKATMSFVVPC